MLVTFQLIFSSNIFHTNLIFFFDFHSNELKILSFFPMEKITYLFFFVVFCFFKISFEIVHEVQKFLKKWLMLATHLYLKFYYCQKKEKSPYPKILPS